MLDGLVALLKYVGDMILLGFVCLIFLFAFVTIGIVILCGFIGLLTHWGIIGGIAKISILLVICFGIGILVNGSKL